MNHLKKNDIRSNIRLMNGLAHILEDDIDNLRITSNDFDLGSIYTSIKYINETLEKIIDIVAEIEYALYMDLLER